MYFHSILMGPESYMSFIVYVYYCIHLYISFFIIVSPKKNHQNFKEGKTRDLFKKIRDTKGTFHANMGSIKDRSGMDLTEAEDIKRWQEYTEELYRKDLHDPDNHGGVITQIITMV